MPLHEYTPGLKIPQGFQPVNPIPLDAYSGPYMAGTSAAAVSAALENIPQSLRFLSMEVRILAPDPNNAGQTLPYKYWFSGTTADSGLTLFSAGEGGGGAAFDSGTTYIWTAYQNFSAGFSAAGGITFNSLASFNSGASASGATLGTLVVINGISASNGATFNNNVYVGGTLSVNGNLFVAGTMTTVNESQLLIQDKYLVLGSTYATSAQVDGAGIYLGSTTSAIAGICYSNSGSYWSSSHSFNIPSGSTYMIGGNVALAATYLGSSVTGSSLSSVGIITSGEWRGTVIGITWGGLGTNLNTSSYDGAVLAIGRSVSGGPRVTHPLYADAFGEYTILGGMGIGDNLSDSSTPFWISGVSDRAWATSARGHRKSRKTSVKRYDQVFGSGTGLDNGAFTNSEFNPSSGDRGVTFTIPISSLKPDSSNNGKEDYLFWDDYNSSNISGVSAMSYNLETGIVYFKQLEAIVDGGTW